MADPTTHEVTIPAADPGAIKAPRKLLFGLDETQRGGFQLLGAWLDAGGVYELPTNALVFGNDQTGVHSRVRLWRVLRDGTLKPERDSTFAALTSTYGKSVVGTLRSKLAKYPSECRPARQIRPAPPRPNTREGRCRRCYQIVTAGAGVLIRGTDRTEVQHVPPCPPRPPTATRYAQACEWCRGWMESGEGIVLSAGDPLPAFGAHGRSIDDCPPPEQRKPEPPVANGYDGECSSCRRAVPADHGLYDRQTKTVRHRDGQCPESKQPLWRITYGRPGRFHPRPAAGYQRGQVRRETVSEREHPVPPNAPGYQRVRDGAVSVLVVVVDELPPQYCRDEDGSQPSDLIGEDGWLFRANARLATEQEAAATLAAEAQQRLRAELDRRCRTMLVWRYGPGSGPTADAERPVIDHAALNARTVPVQFEERLVTATNWSTPADELRVDEAAGEVWTLVHNGADGDDWSANNVGRYIGWRHPLTVERRQLIDELRVEYGNE